MAPTRTIMLVAVLAAATLSARAMATEWEVLARDLVLKPHAVNVTGARRGVRRAVWGAQPPI